MTVLPLPLSPNTAICCSSTRFSCIRRKVLRFGYRPAARARSRPTILIARPSGAELVADRTHRRGPPWLRSGSMQEKRIGIFSLAVEAAGGSESAGLYNVDIVRPDHGPNAIWFGSFYGYESAA